MKSRKYFSTVYSYVLLVIITSSDLANKYNFCFRRSTSIFFACLLFNHHKMAKQDEFIALNVSALLYYYYYAVVCDPKQQSTTK